MKMSSDAATVSRHAQKIVETVGSKTNSSLLAASWRRCIVVHDLHPDTPHPPFRHDSEALGRARERDASMIEAAGPHLDQAHALLEDADCAIFLADRAGIVLEIRSPPSKGYLGRAVSRWVGLDLSEPREGTNAVGTCLVERRPVTLVAGDHFLTRNAGLVCDGVPIFDAIGGLAGAIDVTRLVESRRPEFDRAILAIATDVAQSIELALFLLAFSTARKILAGPKDCNGMAVLAVNARDQVIGATQAARQQLGLTPLKMSAPFPSEDIWPRDDKVQIGTLEAIERTAIQRAIIRHGDNVSAAARALGVSRGTLHRKIAAWRD